MIKPHCSNIFCKISRIFEPNLNLWKTDSLTLFQKSISQSVFILAIVSDPHFLISFSHLSSTVLENKTIFVQLIMTDVCFSDSQNRAKNGDSVPSIIRVDFRCSLEFGLRSSSSIKKERRLLSRAAAGNGALVITGVWKLPKIQVLFRNCETYPSRIWAMWRAKLFFLSNQKPLQPKNTESNLWMKKSLPDSKYFIRCNYSDKTAGKSTCPNSWLI